MTHHSLNTHLINDFFLPRGTLLKIETVLKCQKKYPALNFVYKWITENSWPVVESTILTSSRFLLEY